MTATITHPTAMVMWYSETAERICPTTTTFTTPKPPPTTMLRVDANLEPQNPKEYREVAIARRPV